jgi:hypothetical protein
MENDLFVPLMGGPGEDIRCKRLDMGTVRATAFPAQIWDGNGFTRTSLRHLVHLHCPVGPCPMSARTRSEARWSFGSAR